MLLHDAFARVVAFTPCPQARKFATSGHARSRAVSVGTDFRRAACFECSTFPSHPPWAQVVFPFLELRVRNVTRAYEMEHKHEVSPGSPSAAKGARHVTADLRRSGRSRPRDFGERIGRSATCERGGSGGRKVPPGRV